METHYSNGSIREISISSDELKCLDLYFNRPAKELIFLTKMEHRKIHMLNKHFFNNGEAEILSEVCPKGFIKGRVSSSVEKSAEKHKGLKHSEETKIKMHEGHKNLRWFNNGLINKYCKECPEGFVSGRLVKSNNLHFYNNGEIEVRCKVCPPGFVLGGLPKEKRNFSLVQ